MSFRKPDLKYWNNKFIAYLHDPIDKVLKIQGHEGRSTEQMKEFGITKPMKEFWKTADGIASGFERGQVPSYDKDINKNGAVNFLEYPLITHPLSKNSKLIIDGLENSGEFAQQVEEDLISFIKEEIGAEYGDGGYSDKFKGNEEAFALARFLYIHLVLRFRLAENDNSKLGGLWHRLPADTRFPDHTIWQHNALTSALNSCMELAGIDDEDRAKQNIGLMVFSITPVQPFIAKARKLRDYWTGSILLSWLAFEGIKWIMENLGPDHIVYPSLIDQPLVTQYLNNEKWKLWRQNPDIWRKQPKDIASFPNKFLSLIPLNYYKEISGEIQNHIKKQWIQLTEHPLSYLKTEILKDTDTNYIDKMFKRQNDNFWDFNCTAVKLLSIQDKEEFKNLLHSSNYEEQKKVFDIFNKIYGSTGEGIFYSTSHSLAQSALAAKKTKKTIKRKPETGEKCSLCGEFEVLHSTDHKGKKAKEYNDHLKFFWKELADKWKSKADFKKNERLCSICLTKRIICKLIIEQNDEKHLLYKIFKNPDSFPSVTEIALYDFYKRNHITEKKERIAQDLYENDMDRLPGKYDSPLKDKDKYYAILMMDGDKMGDLVNGKTIESTWESIMHPQVVERLQNKDFDELYRNSWEKLFNQRRLITPAIHAAISESLGDFSIYSVDQIIRKHKGRLIYAGGDDVCAVMPVDTVLEATQEIRKAYNYDFSMITGSSKAELIQNKTGYRPEPGKLSIGLGKGEKISISAGILICHHKENLSHMIQRAHDLLDRKAKNELERNACVIELKKRSGGSRYFCANWNKEDIWKSFKNIGQRIKKAEEDGNSGISTSLVYRLEKFRDGFEAVKKFENNNEKLIKLVVKQLEKSGIKYKKEEKSDIARDIVNLVLDQNDEFKPERLIVAGFLGGREVNND